jgi:hypothetical protein
MAATRMVMKAFNQGAVPTIACINRAKTDLGVDFDRLVPALQTFLDDCFAPIWGTPARLIKATKPQSGCWTMIFFDRADQKGAEGYHDLQKNNQPLSKIFVKATLASGDKISVTACHELAEMMVDPATNLWAKGRGGRFYAYEMCDAVEEEEFEIDGIAMSDFVYPAYFELFRKPKSVQFDYLNKVTRPFELLKGGYAIVHRHGRVKEIYGSLAKKRRFAKEDRRFHRSSYRK